MFGSNRQAREQAVFIVVKEQHGRFDIAMGNGTKTYRDLGAASLAAGRMASKMNDGRYYVFQAVSVSEVVTPAAVTRPLSPGAAMVDGLVQPERAPKLA